MVISAIYFGNGIKLIELFYKRFMERLAPAKRIILFEGLDHSIYSYY